MSKMKWLIVHTRPGSEKRVAQTLSQKGLSTFCPSWTQAGSSRRAKFEPVIPTYVFVQVSPENQEVITRVNAVRGFVYWKGGPATVSEAEIELMQSFISENELLRVEKTSVQPGDMARITTSSLVNEKGLQNDEQDSLLKMTLPSLGFAMVARNAGKAVEMGHAVFYGNKTSQYEIAQ